MKLSDKQRKLLNDPFAVTDREYSELMSKFANLCYFASWQLMRKNIKNNHTEDIEDITQQLHMAVVRAGRYYKRQVYIESCLNVLEKFVKDNFVKNVVKQLRELWNNRTKHGANKKKFGDYQEKMMIYFVNKCVPKRHRPNIYQPLIMDDKFITYCKAIAWNAQKSLGRKISKERNIRSNCVSLSEFDFVTHYI